VDLVAQQPIAQFSVYIVKLDPTVGVEMRKARPCVVVSPETMHRWVQSVIIAPMTSTQTGYPTRVASNFQGRPGEIALDQMRSVDTKRLAKHLGQLDAATSRAVKKSLLELFG
jgi:mRNA interferase MazF